MTNFELSTRSLLITAAFVAISYQILPSSINILAILINLLLLCNYCFRWGYTSGEEQGMFDTVNYISDLLDGLPEGENE